MKLLPFQLMGPKYQKLTPIMKIQLDNKFVEL